MKNAAGDTVGFVLLYGAGLGAWIWEEVRKQLSGPALAVDFPGRGTLDSVKTEGLTMHQYIQAIAEQMQSFSPQKWIIVAHSISGVLGLELVDLFEDRVVGFIAVGAAIPKGSGSFLSSFPLMNRVFLRLVLSMIGTKPPESAVRHGLCSDLGEEESRQVIERFVPESKRLYIDSIQRKGRLPHTAYIRLTEDRELNDPMQSRMIANLEADQVFELASGHLPMMSKPEALADLLNRYARTCGGFSHQPSELGTRRQ